MLNKTWIARLPAGLKSNKRCTFLHFKELAVLFMASEGRRLIFKTKNGLIFMRNGLCERPELPLLLSLFII
jgi:hypothetical protein